MTSSHIPTNCDIDAECSLSVTSRDGFVVFDKAKVKPNTRYFICASSSSTVVEREWFSENLDALSSCSNGFIIDTIAPEPGHIAVKNYNGFLSSSSNIFVHWEKFSDNVKASAFGRPSDIKEYVISCGKCCNKIIFYFFQK